MSNSLSKAVKHLESQCGPSENRPPDMAKTMQHKITDKNGNDSDD